MSYVVYILPSSNQSPYRNRHLLSVEVPVAEPLADGDGSEAGAALRVGHTVRHRPALVIRQGN